jgi:hypothetical protein
VEAAFWISSVTVTLVLVLPSETMFTVVEARPALSVVQPGLTVNVSTLSAAVVSAVPDIGVTCSHGTVGGVTVKYPVPDAMDISDVPDELQVEPMVQVRLMVATEADSAAACKPTAPTVSANGTEKILSKRR